MYEIIVHTLQTLTKQDNMRIACNHISGDINLINAIIFS